MILKEQTHQIVSKCQEPPIQSTPAKKFNYSYRHGVITPTEINQLEDNPAPKLILAASVPIDGLSEPVPIPRCPRNIYNRSDQCALTTLLVENIRTDLVTETFQNKLISHYYT